MGLWGRGFVARIRNPAQKLRAVEIILKETPPLGAGSFIHVGSKAHAVKTYEYFVKSVSESLRTDLEGLREFLESIDPKMASAGKRNPADFIDESVLDEALRAR